MERQYDFEALAEVTATDWNIGRGELNAALKSIRAQSEITDSYLLSVEIHNRAGKYRAVFEGAALTPTALSKHWKRVDEETKARKPLPPPKPLPTSRREQNREAAQQLMKEMGWR